MTIAHRLFFKNPTVLQLHESRIPDTRSPGGVDIVLSHGMELCKRRTEGTWQTVWSSTGSYNLWPLWLLGPLGGDTCFFAYDFSTQGFGSSGLRPAQIAGNVSATQDMGVNDFQGLGRDDSGRLTRRTWLFATSLGSNFMMSLAVESVERCRIAVESFAGFVFFGVPHRCSKMATLDRHTLRSRELLRQLAEQSAYLESLPTEFMEQLQRQKELGRPWHVLSFVQTKPFLHGIGAAAGMKSASELANEIQYCDAAHIDACQISDSEEAAFKILGEFMKAAGSSPIGSFEQTSVAPGAPIHQLEGVKGRVTAHALITGLGDAVAASARLQAHGQRVGLTPLAAAGSMRILCNFGPGVECPAAAAGLRSALEAVCAEHAASSYCFTVHGSTGDLIGSIGKSEVPSPHVLNIDGIWVLSPEGGSLSQLVLVTGCGIASAELQLWEGSGVRCISPLDAGDAERLGAAWILAAGKALGPRLEAVLYKVEAPPDTQAVVQLGTERGVSLSWLVPLGDMARAGHGGLSCTEGPPSPKEPAARAVAGTRRAEAESLIRFLQGAELKASPTFLETLEQMASRTARSEAREAIQGPMSEEQHSAAIRPQPRKVFLHRRPSQKWRYPVGSRLRKQSPQHIQDLQSRTQDGQHQAAAAGSPTAGVLSSSGEHSMAKRESAAEEEHPDASAGINPMPSDHSPPPQAERSVLTRVQEMVSAGLRLLG